MITSSLVLLLTFAAEPSTPARYAEAVEVYHCGFEAAHDINYDSWPDHWIRHTGPGYPKYLPVEIVSGRAARGSSREQDPPLQAAPSPQGTQHLRVALDGGAASLSSPPIGVNTQFSYVLEAQLRTAGLRGHAASFSLSFLDGDGNTVQRFESPRYRNFADWTRVSLGPVEPRGDKIQSVVIGLHLQPGPTSDLFGEALFDDVWLGRLPRMSLASNSVHNIFIKGKPIEITCKVSGFRHRDPLVTFELLDVFGRQLAAVDRRLEGSAVDDDALLAAAWLQPRPSGTEPETQSFAGQGVWQPPITESGYYWVRVTMRGNTGVMHQRNLTLAVVERMRSPKQGEFGWSLPRGDDPLPFGPLAEVLESAGVNWVKYPVWRGEEEQEWGNRFARFAEQIAGHNIRIVGMLDQPPAKSRHLFGQEDQDRLLAAHTFNEAELWMSLIDPVMTRSALNIRWWQIGGDDDTSFVGYAHLPQKIIEIKRHMERFGQEISLGFSWRWLEAAPQGLPGQPPPWAFVSHTHALDPHTRELHPAFTGEELQTQLRQKSAEVGQRWIMLEPLSRQHYSLETRALDLVERMIAAKIAKADAVFIPKPFDPNHGLMRVDGSPGDLLLPWRTTSLTLAGMEFAGKLQLPEGSENRVFLADGEAVMVLWSETPKTETLYLGENVQQIDLWGRVTTPETIVDDQGGKQQRIEVGRLPLFLIGVQPQVAQWRMAFQFRQEALPSVFGRQLPVGYEFQNTFGQGVGGNLKINTPPEWDVARTNIGFKLGTGEKRSDEFLAWFGLDASSGPTPLRIDFEVTADRVYRFSVYRTQQVGLGEVEIEITSHLDEQGNLVVDQLFTNHTSEHVSFNCILFAPGRRRDRQPIIDIPRGQHKSRFIMPRGADLLGQTLYLRAEEINGDRVLSYRFKPGP